MKLQLAGLAAGLLMILMSAGGASAAASCGANTGTAADGEPIVIGALTGQTGPDDFSSSTKAAKAFFDCVNANGGINGRPIDYRIADDQWNPELAAQLAAGLVNDNNAVAMVGSASFVECAANAALYEQSGIIALAGVGVPRECFYGKNYVTTNAGPRVSTAGATIYAIEQLGAKSLTCIGPNIPGVGEWSCAAVKDIGDRLGYPVQVIIMDPASADFTSTVLQAMSTNPDAVITVVPKGLTVPLLQAAEEQGFNEQVPWLSAASAYDLSVPEAIGPGWDGRFYANMEFNDAESTEPDNQNWRAVMDEYGQASDPRDTFSQAGYLAARIATDILLKLPADQVTRENFTKAIGEVTLFQSDIFCAPWYFDPNASHHNPNSTTRMSVAKGRKWEVISECEPSQDPELADIREFEKTLAQ